MDIGTPLVADGKAAKLGEPGQGALDFPTVSAETLAAVDAAPGDARSDAAGAALSAAAAMVVGLVSVEFVRAAARSSLAAPDRWHRIQRWRQHAAIVPVGPTDGQAKRRALAIDDQVTLGARLAAVRRIGPGLRAPL